MPIGRLEIRSPALLAERALCAATLPLRRSRISSTAVSRVEDPDLVPGADDLVGGTWLVLRRGKKRFAGVEVA